MKKSRNYKQQKSLPNFLNDLKTYDSYSRSSKFYDKSIKSKKIREIMKTMGLLKNREFSEFEMYNKNKKRNHEIPFNIQKVKSYLLKIERQKKEKEIIKQEKLNNTAIKKLHRMTELNIEHYKNMHPYIPPSIGTYSPNYDSIFKKTQATIILEDNKESKEKNIKKKSRVNILKDFSLKILSNNNKFNTISTRNTKKVLLSEEKDNKANILSYKVKDKNIYPLISETKEKSSNFNTLSNGSISSTMKKNILKRKKIPKIKNSFFTIKTTNNNNTNSSNRNSSENIKNNSNSSRKKMDNNNNIDIFNKTRTYNIYSIFRKSFKKNKKIKSLLSRNKNNSMNIRTILSHKTMDVKPSVPSIGYYHPKYDYVKESIPKISFLYHNKEKNGYEYKKNLLRKIISKYEVNSEYQIIKKLNMK